MATYGQCLCGANRFRLDGELSLMHHCHCGYCRISHGTPYGTVIAVDPSDLSWERQGNTIRYAASPSYTRIACADCGSPLPSEGEGMPRFVPNGLLDEAGEHRAEFHMFFASKADWFDFEDPAPRFDGFPPGIDAPASAPLASSLPEGAGARGRCLCGDVEFVVEEPVLLARFCHCRRCQRARGAASACNLVAPAASVRFEKGRDAVRDYKLPEARFFAQSFCGGCAGKVPRVDPARDLAIVPMGSLLDRPPALPQERIWSSERAAWDVLEDSLPRLPEKPTS